MTNQRPRDGLTTERRGVSEGGGGRRLGHDVGLRYKRNGRRQRSVGRDGATKGGCGDGKCGARRNRECTRFGASIRRISSTLTVCAIWRR